MDEVLLVDKREVRHCNWVRFLHATTDMNDVNLVARRVDRRPQFQVVKPLPVNAELKVTPSHDTRHFPGYKLLLAEA